MMTWREIVVRGYSDEQAMQERGCSLRTAQDAIERGRAELRRKGIPFLGDIQSDSYRNLTIFGLSYSEAAQLHRSLPFHAVCEKMRKAREELVGKGWTFSPEHRRLIPPYNPPPKPPAGHPRPMLPSYARPRGPSSERIRGAWEERRMRRTESETNIETDQRGEINAPD